MKGIMVMGTASDVGKSLVCTALCRLLANDGIRVAPFKSQNLSPYTELAIDGTPISRAQFIQAEAARTQPTADMNPIILQPGADGTLTGTFCGEPLKPVNGMAYRDVYFEQAIQAIERSLESLGKSFEAIVIEGAGSPVEMNLRARDIVNMRVAELADVPVVLVADIDRGGVFASIVGTLELLQPSERNRVKAIVINKFKGDPAGFQEGVEFIESYTGIPIVGVLPFKNDHGIAEEDTERPETHAPNGVDPYEAWSEHVRKHLNWPLLKEIMGVAIR
ncbi:cobyric acid synthase [Sporosarcina sp. BI001-red]|uniref:cobyric acid synthase n=1 Tax=Sporosarcina sp. BI001-red TaxID=2282866 RepID=UPI000E26794E|nr:cobyric acid synthase [Sporosarcina sp. BI001-red]REB05933.1 cobyric acid synthase [Sporosarcina sp. BI001-red]